MQRKNQLKMGNSTFGILLGRKSSKFMCYLKHAITRSSYLKNRQQALYSYSNLDVVQLLNLGHQDQALVRVEHVIKSKDMLDVFDMIDSYCNLLAQNSSFIQKSKECPEEYKEAIGGLIFASSRIGDFPELQHIRNYFTSKFGHDFVIQALESPTYFGVNDKIVQKLSRSRPSLETKYNFVKEIASKNEIRVNLHLDAHIQQH